MRLQTITVDNFKSLVGFKLDLAKFTCLIGLNGAGKSTVLQFIDFLGQQVRGNIDDWLTERSWRPDELMSKVGSGADEPSISFSVTLTYQRDTDITWAADFDPSRRRCIRETIQAGDASLKVRAGKYWIRSSRRTPGTLQKPSGPNKIPFTYQGSILSQLEESLLPLPLKKLKAFFLATESVDLLAPELLRQASKTSDGSVGRGGRDLSAFVDKLEAHGRRDLSVKLKKAYGHLHHLLTKPMSSGSKELFALEKRGPALLRIGARHINDGMLRFIAILAELESKHGFLLFDEIENGFSPELIERLLDTLVGADKQILVTTHSPMILNYLEDDVAKRGVTYIYKTRLGRTQAIPFFEIPSLAEKLTVMGPGEAFVDTNLMELAKEIASLNGKGT